MKGVKKVLMIVGIVIIVLLGLVALIFSLAGENMIKGAVEAAATKTLGVKVTIEAVDLSIFGGSVGIKGLVINNPQGYKHPTMLELDKASVKLDIGSLTKDTIHISNVELDGTNFTLEQNGLTNNLQEILKNIPSEEKKDGEPKEGEAKPGKNLVINKLVIANTTVNAKLLPIPGKSDTVTMKIDTITMENLGDKEKMNTGKLIATVLKAIAKGITKQGAGVLPKDMVGSTEKALESLGGEGKKILEGGKGAAGGVVEGIKGIFDKKK